MSPLSAKIVSVALPLAIDQQFDYYAPADGGIDRGTWVYARLGAKKYLGVVSDIPAVAAVEISKLRPILGVAIGLPALSSEQLALARFIADYYQASYGMALALLQPPPIVAARTVPTPAVRITEKGRHASILPQARLQHQLLATLREGDSHCVAKLAEIGSSVRSLLRDWLVRGWIERADHLAPLSPLQARLASTVTLNVEQVRAAATIIDSLGRFAPLVLHGVTGSGKTAVYMKAAAEAIARGGQVLLLAPEINLTPQLADRIRAQLPGVRLALLHSGLSASARSQQWRLAADGEADLVIGTRLAVFAPLRRLALLIVDEEHDASFKQQDGVRYHARDVALYCAKQRGVPIVLGSATPALETFHLACTHRFGLLELRERATVARMPPVNFTAQHDVRAVDGLSARLLQAMEARLARGEQCLLFINRRGYAPSLLCRACGWAAPCPRCAARLVVHKEARVLRCHHCGSERTIIERCPECGNQDLLPLGYGTQRLAETLQARFPSARILRIDRDSTRRRAAWPEMLARIERGEADILVGTQMLAKGHDFPRLTLVGVLGADNALYSADFRATERVFAQLLQVAGRAGRGDLGGEVIVQTDYPTHPVYLALATHDYATFAHSLLAERQQANLPPFSYLALLRAEAPQRRAVDAFFATAHRAAGEAAACGGAQVQVHAPIAALMARRAGFERAQMLFQGAARKPLLAVLRTTRAQIAGWRESARVRWSFDVDPVQID